MGLSQIFSTSTCSAYLSSLQLLPRKSWDLRGGSVAEALAVKSDDRSWLPRENGPCKLSADFHTNSFTNKHNYYFFNSWSQLSPLSFQSDPFPSPIDCSTEMFPGPLPSRPTSCCPLSLNHHLLRFLSLSCPQVCLMLPVSCTEIHQPFLCDFWRLH